uniref:Uncharacterized protein n=1 Tax=Acrobeloides nanus TaxID=290746 RepID=A0A914C0P7_9BILA
MAQYRSSSPISGFGGHIPGNKWHVGSRTQIHTNGHASGHNSDASSKKASEGATMNESMINSFDYYNFLKSRPDQAQNGGFYPHGYQYGYPIQYGSSVPPGYYNQMMQEQGMHEQNGVEAQNGFSNPLQHSIAQTGRQASPMPQPTVNNRPGHGNNHRPQTRVSRTAKEQASPNRNSPTNGTNFSRMPTEIAMNSDLQTQRSFNGFPPPGITTSHTMHDLNTSMQNLQLSPNQQNALNSNHDGAFHGGHVQHGNGENALENRVEQMKRSQSLPRKKLDKDIKDPFEGLEGGWWSEGQALKNIKKHENMIKGANEAPSAIKRKIRQPTLTQDDNDIPSSGYSGHIPGFKTHSVGKPFTVAAKDSLKHMRDDYNASFNFASNNETR